MQLWVAILLFLLSVAGAVLSARKLRHNKPLRVVCIALCAVIAAACAVYIVLTAIMLYAASTTPITANQLTFSLTSTS